jgi:hypothetical protein
MKKLKENAMLFGVETNQASAETHFASEYYYVVP